MQNVIPATSYVHPRGSVRQARQNVGGVSRIIAAGQNGTSFAVVGVNPNGTLDTSFASNGVAITNFCGTNASLRGLALDSAGNIYASGVTSLTSRSYRIIALVKYTSYGAVDTTFGNPSPSGSGRLGYTLLDFYANSSTVSGGTTSLLATTDTTGATKLLLGTISGSSAGSVFGLARYNANGTLDSTFGGAGALAFTWGSDDIAEGLAVQSNGEIIEVGSSGSSGNDNFTLFRIWP